MSVHNKLNDLKKWIEVDIVDSPIRNKALDLIKKDASKDSPDILKDIDGKYSPFRNKLSGLGKAQLDMLKMDKKLSSTIYVTLAAAKFKRLLKNRSPTKINESMSDLSL